MIQKCSNCGKINEYEEGEYKSREETECKSCGHVLSICSWFIEHLENK